MRAARELVGDEQDFTAQAYLSSLGRLNGSGVPLREIYTAFGSWNAAREALGLPAGAGRPVGYTRENVDQALQAAKEELGEVITAREYEEWAKRNQVVCIKPIERVYGSYNAAAKANGIRTRRSSRVEPGPELEAIVRKVCRGEYLSARAYKEVRREVPGAPSSQALINAYGSWLEVMRAAGFEPPER